MSARLKPILKDSKLFAHFLMRTPRRVLKAKPEDDYIVNQPAQLRKRKPRLFRASYLMPSTAAAAQPTASVSPSIGPTSWRNLQAENDLDLLTRMRFLTRGLPHKSSILLEGRRPIKQALECGVSVDYFIFTDPKVLRDLPTSQNAGDAGKMIRVSVERMAAWSKLDTPPGIMAIAKRPLHSAVIKTLSDAVLPLHVVCDGIKDPSNVGSILRSLASIGCQSVLMLKGCANAWGVKVLRAACGAHFCLPIYENLSLDQVIGYLPAKYSLLVADAHGDKSLLCGQSLLTTGQPTVLVVGGEAGGVSEAVQQWAANRSGCRLHIPMANQTMCLNVAVATSIIAFEIRRMFIK